jgi:DNA replication protein DnaC
VRPKQDDREHLGKSFADLDDVAFVEEARPEVLGDYTSVRDQLAELVDHPGTVILRGDNGPGKSHLSSALVRRFCELGKPAKYTTASDFFLELKSTFGAEGRTQMDLIKRYRRYALLVLDEYEVRSDSDWENGVLRSLIDSRYAGLVATVIISNLTVEKLNDYLQRAVRDRIREDGSIIDCAWGSLRPMRRQIESGKAVAR